MPRPSSKQIILFLVCAILAFLLRFYAFDQKSLWIDEVHTFNDSRDDLKAQIQFYRENPTFLHPPLFFILTHQFYPFPKPERDLRIIPLIFGTLSIPMIYLLSRTFAPPIALPCTLALTFMTYHISLSQDGRSYSLLMFLGMAALYFFMRHLQTSHKRYLFPVAFLFAILFHTSYSSIPFIALSQVLWLYRPDEAGRRPSLSSFLFLNSLTFLFCLPWLLFVAIHYKGEMIMDSLHGAPGTLVDVASGVFHDWVPHAPLTVVSVMLLIVFPVVSKSRRNALVLLGLFLLPSAGLYLFCKLFKVTHFISSRYLINFLPLFFITLYLSLQALEFRFDRLKRFLRPTLLFTLLLIASNLVTLPLYYRSEKQDFRGLVNYLGSHLRNGDKIFVQSPAYIPGILHYFKIIPTGRHYSLPFRWSDSGKEIELQKTFTYRDETYTIYCADACCDQYLAGGNRLWIVVAKESGKRFTDALPCVLKGYFDGSFSTFRRFPTDASMYLFLWDPRSPPEMGIDMKGR